LHKPILKTADRRPFWQGSAGRSADFCAMVFCAMDFCAMDLCVFLHAGGGELTGGIAAISIFPANLCRMP